VLYGRISRSVVRRRHRLLVNNFTEEGVNPQIRSSRRLRVLHCITRLGLGGAERVAFAIMRELRKEVDFAVFTVHAASRDEIGAELQGELTVTQTPWFIGTRVQMRHGGMLPGGIALAHAVRSWKPDIVHYHSETPEACGAVMTCIPGFGQHRTIRTIHNSIFWRYWPRIGRWCDRQLAAATIVGVSEAALVEFLRYRRDSGVPPATEEPAVIYNGVSLPLLPPRTGPRLPHLRRVLFAGRFEDQKGTDVICRALPLVRLPAGTTGELTFVGDGAHRSVVTELMVRAPRGWTVDVRRPVAGLAPVFSEFDLLVMPSRFEGLGLVAIEATFSGLPVVTTDAPGLREVFPSDYPWRAIPGDENSLAAVLTVALEATSLWAATVRTVQDFGQTRFSPSAMGKGYLRTYQAIGMQLAT